MLDPGLIVETIAEKLRDVPELGAVLGTNSSIRACHPEFAGAANFRKILHNANPGDVLVRWEGTGPGRVSENTVWAHRIGIYVRPFDSSGQDEAHSHYDAVRLIVDGVPERDGVKLLNQQILPQLYLMDVPTLQIVVDTEGLEYFLVTCNIPEIGDN